MASFFPLRLHAQISSIKLSSLSLEDFIRGSHPSRFSSSSVPHFVFVLHVRFAPFPVNDPYSLKSQQSATTQRYKMDSADETDSQFFVEEILDGDLSATTSEEAVWKFHEAGDNNDDDAMLVMVPDETPGGETTRTIVPYYHHHHNDNEINLRRISVSDHNTTTVHHHENSHNSVFNITNVYHKTSEGEDNTQRPGTQQQAPAGPQNDADKEEGLQSDDSWYQEHALLSWLKQLPSPFPMWAVRLVVWLLRALQSPADLLFRFCLRLVFQGVTGILLLLVISFLGFWVLKWWWWQALSLPYTILHQVYYSTMTTSAWLWLRDMASSSSFQRTSTLAKQHYSTFSTTPTPTPTTVATSTQTPTLTFSVTKTVLSSAALTVPSIILWGEGYMRIASSVTGYGLETWTRSGSGALFAAPLATAQSVLPKFEAMYRTANTLKDHINAELVKETSRARRLERRMLLHVDLQAMMESQEAEVREAWEMRMRLREERGRYCSTDPTMVAARGWLKNLVCWIWQYLESTLNSAHSGDGAAAAASTYGSSGGVGIDKETGRPVKLKTHSVVEGWLIKELAYLNEVQHQRLEWQAQYKKVVDNRVTEELGRAHCKIFKTAKRQRQKMWEEKSKTSNHPVDDEEQGLTRIQLTDIESLSRLECEAYGPMVDYSQVILLKLKSNLVWLSERIQETLDYLGDMDDLQEQQQACNGGSHHHQQPPGLCLGALLTADALQAIRDHVIGTLVRQESTLR